MATKSAAPINPTAKWQFQQSVVVVAEHRKLVDLPAFQRAIDAARLQYQRVLTDGAPVNVESANYLSASAVCFQRMKGVNDFIDILLRLAEPPQQRPTTPTTDNLEQKN